MFFLLSGMTFRYHTDQKQYWIQVAKRIILPYFGVGLFSIVVYRLLGGFAAKGLGTSIQETTIWEDLLHLLYGSSLHGAMKWNESLWFLPCYVCVIILANLVGCVMNRAGKLAGYAGKADGRLAVSDNKKLSTWIPGIAAVLFLLIGLYLTQWSGEQANLPWHLETAFLMFPVFTLGHYWKKTLESCTKRKLWIVILSCLVAFVCSIYQFRALGAAMSIRTNELPNVTLCYVFLVFGMMTIWYLACMIDMTFIRVGKNSTISLLTRIRKVVSIVGQSTLEILVWNKFAVLVCQLLLPRIIHGSGKWFIETTSVGGLILSLCLAVPCIAACLIWTRALEHLKQGVCRRNLTQN